MAVVDHDRLAILAQLHVELDCGHTEGDRALKAGERVLLMKHRDAAMPHHDGTLFPAQKRIGFRLGSGYCNDHVLTSRVI